ncbi:MAG TPA: phytanoyl-CoA dioxygenase family protein [Burkholderiales bacterium]|nr:phytanoyl-CoA dioxygenase family protein [Burkholderiales bacterium]
MGLRELVARSRVLVEDMVLTSPRLAFRPRLAEGMPVSEYVRGLQDKGYASIGSLLSPAELREIRTQIDAALSEKRADIAVKWSDKVQYARVINPLRLHEKLLALAAHPLALAVAEAYFRRQPYLADVDLRRVEAVSMESLGPQHVSSSSWHRDTRGRQLKLMVYLSDVTAKDSNFSLVPGSHRGQHLRKGTYMESRLGDAEVADLQTLEWYGAAGEAMLFDTNVIHRLRRKAGAAVRDSITYYYTPGQSLFALDYPAEALHHLPEASRVVFSEPGWPLSRLAA